MGGRHRSDDFYTDLLSASYLRLNFVLTSSDGPRSWLLLRYCASSCHHMITEQIKKHRQSVALGIGCTHVLYDGRRVRATYRDESTLVLL